jgi:hypothetical protein
VELRKLMLAVPEWMSMFMLMLAEPERMNKLMLAVPKWMG